MKTYELILGLGDKKTRQQKYSTIEAYKIVNNLICSRFGGGTIYENRGVYTYENGQIVVETSLRICLPFTNDEAVKVFADNLKEMFDQETVIIQSLEVTNI